MISKALPQEKKTLYGIWKQVFSGDDGGYTDYFFHSLYQSENTVVYKEAGSIVSTLMRIPHEMMLHGRPIRISMILGVATVPNFRRQGYMHALMNDVLDEIEHQELVTLIQAYTPSAYTQFGFEMVYHRRKTIIQRSQIPLYNNEGLTYKINAKDLLVVYLSFTKRFNGYYLRDLAYFEKFIQEVSAENGKIIAYIDKNGQIQGYATLYQTAQGIELKECLYLNSAALLKLINLGLQLKDEIVLHTTNSEELSRIIKGLSWQDYGFTMARINDYELFNRYFNCQVSTVKDAFAISGKPLFMHEYA